ncbi:MAG TPA: CapA family protein [Fimbriimonadaceae bacterium]|nr:CapA family protein [Fimbriimonadaceae bacterium]
MILAAMAAVSMQSHNSLTLLFGGDIMLNQIPVEGKPLAALKPVFATADVRLANLEIPLTDANTPTQGKSAAELKARTQFILKADPRHIDAIRGIGIQLVSLGNNHAMDYGPRGLSQMIGLLDKAALQHSGAGATLEIAKLGANYSSVSLISALAFMGTRAIKKLTPATPSSAGIHALIFAGVLNKKNREYLKSWIAATPNDGIKVVALHWGIEKQTIPTSYQVSLARACIDAGADIVWGHHPHVLQGAELYKGKPILYSMGNLISRKEGPTGLVRLYYVDEKLQGFRFLPLDIKAMRVSPVGEKFVKGRLENFKKLSEAIQKRFPNKFSRPIYGWPLDVERK